MITQADEGKRVRHPRYGIGKVTLVSGSGQHRRAVVMFDDRRRTLRSLDLLTVVDSGLRLGRPEYGPFADDE